MTIDIKHVKRKNLDQYLNEKHTKNIVKEKPAKEKVINCF